MLGGWRVGKVLDFKPRHVNKMLTFDPGVSPSNGLGFAIVNIDAEIFGGPKNKPFLSHCGLIVPFASAPKIVTMEELCDKAIETWRTLEGFTREPKVLVIEHPIIYPNSPARKQDLLDLGKLAGMLSRCFQPQRRLGPIANEWKGNAPKSATQDYVLSMLDGRSKKILEINLASIPLGKRHNVFDALGLAFYAASVLLKKTPTPINDYQPKEYQMPLIKNSNEVVYARY